MKNRIILFLVLILYSGSVYAQWSEVHISLGFTIPEVALIDIEYKLCGNLDFEVLPSNEPGGELQILQTNAEELWLNYSYAINSFKQKRTIEAQVINGAIPQGCLAYLFRPLPTEEWERQQEL
jgi:hypothetical protein